MSEQADTPRSPSLPADFPSFARVRLLEQTPRDAGPAPGETPNDCDRLGLQRDETLVVYLIPVDLIDPNPNNPNEQDHETFNVLAEEMDETREGSPGMIEPIHVVPMTNGRFQLVGGEHRWKGCKALGKTHVPGILCTGPMWEREEFRDFMLMRLNVLRGKLSAEKFLRLYEKYANTYGNTELQRLFAVTDDTYWEKLTGGAKEGLRDMGMSQEFMKEFEERVQEVKDVDGLAGILHALFNKYGNDLRYSFMVFDFGGRDGHVYVRMNTDMARAMRAVMDWCRTNKADINLVMEPVVREFGKVIGEKGLALLAGSAEAKEPVTA